MYLMVNSLHLCLIYIFFNQDCAGVILFAAENATQVALQVKPLSSVNCELC
jgi:hypothetical protein